MRKSKEEVFLEKMERQAVKDREKAEKAALKLAREEEKRAAKALAQAEKLKPEPTEEELVHRYVNRTIKNSQYHGRVNTEQFQGLEYDKTVSKNLWLDTDFFFSVVFQSRRQKLEFLEKWEQIHDSIDIDIPNRLQIVNGLKLAKALGIELKKEESREYPLPELELLPFILDNEKT